MSDDKSNSSKSKSSSDKSDNEAGSGAVTSSNVFITEKVKRIFRLFDMDQDELINMDEMRQIFHQIG